MFDLQNLDIIPLNGDKKAEKIIKYCKKYNVKQYVETGVYRGATIAEIFKAKKTGKIFSIDFSSFKNITMLILALATLASAPSRCPGSWG